jgi:NTE family protein
MKNQMSTLMRWSHRDTVFKNVPHRLSLALQGGGAHGAFTWGVLDALLDDSTFHFDAVSASSAGAVNAVVMTQGWLVGGREGARQALSDFWLEVGKQIPGSLITNGHDESISFTPAAKMLANWMGQFLPSNFNPMDFNPLRELLTRQVDFERIRDSSPFKLFVGATHVNSGRLRLFREHELTVEMVLASSCLPKIHNTVEVDGEPYWDGGYSANPAVFPLIQERTSSDILLVLLAPHQHDETPQAMQAIETRIQEFGFKTHFLREMNMYARRSSEPRDLPSPWGAQKQVLQQTRFHMIDSNLDVLQRSETQMLAYAPFLEMLKGQGIEQANAWLSRHSASVGKHSSVDLTQWLN